MSEETIIEENIVESLFRKVSETEAALVLLLIYWLMVGFLRYSGALSEDVFFDCLLASGIITPLLQKIRD